VQPAIRIQGKIESSSFNVFGFFVNAIASAQPHPLDYQRQVGRVVHRKARKYRWEGVQHYIHIENSRTLRFYLTIWNPRNSGSCLIGWKPVRKDLEPIPAGEWSRTNCSQPLRGHWKPTITKPVPVLICRNWRLSTHNNQRPHQNGPNREGKEICSAWIGNLEDGPKSSKDALSEIEIWERQQMMQPLVIELKDAWRARKQTLQVPRARDV
jgi:hypothetical protein